MADQMRDVIVVGAGISGLSSGKVLHEAGLDVLVLEARDRVGGRTYTKRDPDTYQYCDVGGSYVGPSQNRILRLSKELGLSTYKIYHEGDYVQYSHGKRLRFQGAWPPFWNPFAWCDVNNLFRRIDQLIEEIPLDSPWDAPHAEEWDNMTMKEFYDKICWTDAAKEFGRSFLNANVSTEPSDVSALWFFWYVKSCGGSKRIWEIENGGQERKFVGGSMQVSERLADLLPDRVLLSKAVKSIKERDGTVTVETMDGKQYQAQHVIVAVAPTLHLKMTFDPPFPPLRYQLIQRVPMGSCIKNTVFYKTAFWRKKGMNGFGTAADGIEPVGNMVDDCKPDGSLPAITGFIMGDQARRLAVMTRDERQQLTCECYARIFGSDEALQPTAYEENNWLAEEYSGGCYTSTYPPCVMTRFGREIRKPHGRIFFAGTETAITWTGYMDGAVEAGERAAREVMHQRGLIAQADIWQEEPPSQDVPELPFETSLLERFSPSVDDTLKIMAMATILTGVTAFVCKDHLLGYVAKLRSLILHV